MKKGVAIGETVIFILGVLVFALIVLFGYKSITEVGEKQQQAEFIKFKTDLQGDINKLSSEYGSVDIEKYEIPQYDTICFIDYTGTDPFPGEDVATDNKLINNAIDDNAANVILASDKGDINLINMEKISGSKCFPIINGKIELRMEGKGGKTKVS